MSLEPFDRAYARYFTLAHLYNAGEPTGILQEYRKALYKLVNSLSWGVTVINPVAIDRQQTIFYIDLRHYEWDRNDAWTKIEEEYPYHIAFDAPAQLGLRNQLGRLQTQMKTDVPSIHIDWFIATASTPPLYHDLLSLPLTDRELETRLEVDVARNLINAPGVRVWRAGFNNSGVSNNNRVVERHTSRYGAYWKSYDFAGSVGTQNIFTRPLNFTHDGGEAIFNLPNGLQGYYLVNASGFRLDEAPINIVSNPAASDPTVRNGISCIGCHTEGMKTFEDRVRSAIESTTNPSYNKAQALRLYVEQSVMDARVSGDMERYREALEATGGLGGVEPISRFHEAFQGPVDAAYAAAVVGLETQTFLERVRENTGLQNIGLLALEGENGSVNRDTWTASFRDVIFALDYPGQVGEPPVVTTPDVIPGGQVHFPDSNLRAAIADALGKRINAPITVEDMQKLERLTAANQRVHNLTGLSFAINLKELKLAVNRISDISVLAELTRLIYLDLAVNDIEDVSALAGLTDLTHLYVHFNTISDMSSLARLTKLNSLSIGHNNISDISPLAGLTNLINLKFYDNQISDISALARLTQLTDLTFSANRVSDISPLAGLISLETLNAGRNQNISNVAPLAKLTNLRWLNVGGNNISDVTPLVALTNLKWLGVYNNKITDIRPLDELRETLTLHWYGNPAFPIEAPKIEGPWLWVVLPNTGLDKSTDLLADVSGGAVKENEISTNGATAGQSVGGDVWTSRKLPVTGNHNVEDMLGRRIDDAIVYGTVSLYSPRQQDTTIYVGSTHSFKVWLNGDLIYQSLRYHATHDYTDFLPVTLRQGKNVLLVAFAARDSSFFGFKPGTEYTVGTGVGYSFSETPVHIGDTFEFDVRAENVSDLAAWQFDIAFDPAILEAVDVSEGDFLKSDAGTTFFQGGRIDNAAGKIIGLIAGRISEGGVSGSGSVLQVRFKAKSEGETELALGNFLFGSNTEESIPAGPLEIRISVEERLLTGDVNRDGVVNILDLIRVARQLGQRVSADSAVDINGDGVVNIFDLTLVAQGIGGAAAPAARGINSATIEAWIAQARLADDGSIAFRQGIQNLQNLLASLIIPQETALLPNYPNPFNPETWIPYLLAAPAEVVLTIYDMNGVTVRRLEMGHQPAGLYQRRSRAVYWDGRNGRGESVASGLYFYTLSAGEFTATRKMLIRK